MQYRIKRNSESKFFAWLISVEQWHTNTAILLNKFFSNKYRIVSQCENTRREMRALILSFFSKSMKTPEDDELKFVNHISRIVEHKFMNKIAFIRLLELNSNYIMNTCKQWENWNTFCYVSKMRTRNKLITRSVFAKRPNAGSPRSNDLCTAFEVDKNPYWNVILFSRCRRLFSSYFRRRVCRIFENQIVWWYFATRKRHRMLARWEICFSDMFSSSVRCDFVFHLVTVQNVIIAICKSINDRNWSTYQDETIISRECFTIFYERSDGLQ